MRVADLSPDEVEATLDFSTSGLARSRPDLSAQYLLSRRGQLVLLGVLAVLVGLLIFDTVDTTIGLISLTVGTYVAVVINRIVLFSRSRSATALEVVTDDEALAVAEEDLPIYTILIPAYKEPEVIGDLLRHLDLMDYPRRKLDIKLLLEADDLTTIDAVRACDPGDQVELVLIPPSEPRTKPKALNYALPLIRGSIVTIYDVEDQPEPLQLRRAAVALESAGDDLACVQAKLSFANTGQNLITKWFTIEYAMWFAFFLPGLVQVGAPVPLGGTSTHFRTEALLQLGAWDPHNVTEDADLGVRLARLGYRCSVLDSTTLEEANSDFVNWVKQRSRWYKGYMQTGFVHLRQPRQLLREIRPVGVAELALFVLGTPLLAFFNIVFWLLTLVWFGAHSHTIKELFPAPLYYTAMTTWIIGNFLVAYMTILTCKLIGRTELVWAALLVPVYWAMMTVAAAKAVWQLVAAPSFWEKTVHGLAPR